MIELSSRQKSVLVKFTVAFVLIASVAIFLTVKIPHSHELMAIPELLFVVAFMLPVLCWQTVAERKEAVRIATVASCVIWVVSVGASFTFRPGSIFLYLGDGLLLMGFVPLLYLWRFSAPWLVLGTLNLGIGVLMQIITYTPDSCFPPSLTSAKHHLAAFHPAMTWWASGVIYIAYGMVRLSKNILKLVGKRVSKPEPLDQA